MNRLKYTVLFVIFFKCVSAIVDVNSSDIITSSSPAPIKNAGEPLFLSRYIEKGEIELARRKALVQYDRVKYIKSYSGFITVDKTFNSNMFFWFFMSQSNPRKDPLILWMDGGPGSSSMSVLFNYHGPFVIAKTGLLDIRRDTLTRNHSVIYIDNPVGAGYSFTENKNGYSHNQEEVGRNLLAFLEQFFKLFPDFRSNDFYVAGDSYGGKFSISMSRIIKEYNRKNQPKINMKGLILGNAFIDPPTQQVHADFLHHIGLVDWNEREQIRAIDEKLGELEKYSSPLNASLVSKVYHEAMKSKRDLIYEFTDYRYIHNYLLPTEPEDREYYTRWIQRSKVRRAIHVGSYPFDPFSPIANGNLMDDMDRSVAPVLAQALDDYRVLVYNGQMDIDFPYSSTLKLYRSLEWSGARDYSHAKKMRWYVDDVLAGYKKMVRNFTEVFVRKAGHIAAYEQPGWICSLITEFTH